MFFQQIRKMSVIVKYEESVDENETTVLDIENCSFDQASSLNGSILERQTQVFLQNFESPRNVNETEIKKEERPVVHRNNGKICIDNYRRHRLLSQTGAVGGLKNENGTNRSPDRLIMPPPPQVSSPRQILTSLTITPAIVPSSMPVNNDNIRGVIQQHQQQQLQQQAQQQAPNQAASIANNDAYCFVCEQQYTSHIGLRKHERTQKHAINLEALQQNTQID